MLLFAVLMQAAGTVVAPGQPEAWGAFGAMLLREDAGATCWWPLSPLQRQWSSPRCASSSEKEKIRKKDGTDKPTRHEKEEKSQ